VPLVIFLFLVFSVFGPGTAFAGGVRNVDGERVVSSHWSGWTVSQNLLERSVVIAEDGAMITDIREQWTCLKPDIRTHRKTRVDYRPIPELTVFESIKISCNKNDILHSFKSGTKKPYARIREVPGLGKTITLNNLRSGQVIEMRLKLCQRPLIPGHFFNTIVLTGPFPVERAIYQVTIPEKKIIFFKQSSTIPSPEISTQKTCTVYRWDIKPLSMSYEYFDGRKNEEGPLRIIVSSTNQWEVIRNWFAGYYPGLEASWPNNEIEGLPKDPQKIQEGAEAIAFIRSVASQIQSSVDRSRLGGLVPSDPGEIWRKKRGDCKDVVALLCYLFRDSPVRVRPVLVSPLNLKKELPNPYIFTHAILKLEISKEQFFFDPLTGDITKESAGKDYFLEL
jgi:hypothetical protein